MEIVSLSVEGYLILLPLIFLAGFIDAISGGGGLLSVPAYMATGLPPHFVLGNNKFSSTFGTLLSTYRYNKRKMANYLIALPGALFALIGSHLGTRTVLLLDPHFLNYVLLFLIPAITLFVWVRKDSGMVKRDSSFSKLQILLLASLAGLIIGFYDGFFGPGTGSFLIFGYTVVLGCDYVGANANAKFVNLASNLAAMITFLINGKVILAIGIPAAVCGIMGNYLGSKLVISNGSRIIRPIFLIVLTLLFIRIIYNIIIQ